MDKIIILSVSANTKYIVISLAVIRNKILNKQIVVVINEAIYLFFPFIFLNKCK